MTVNSRMNLTDCLKQIYRDDGVEGRIWAVLSGGTAVVQADNVPLHRLRIYAGSSASAVTDNGKL